MVLARYMQILSNVFVNRYPRSASSTFTIPFLPAFIGARPYIKLSRRGCKADRGQTSHYVTEVLDDGPIIEQDVVRVSHRDTVDDLIRKGRDLEKSYSPAPVGAGTWKTGFCFTATKRRSSKSNRNFPEPSLCRRAEVHALPGSASRRLTVSLRW